MKRYAEALRSSIYAFTSLERIHHPYAERARYEIESTRDIIGKKEANRILYEIARESSKEAVIAFHK
jgi:hypothetical protein